MADGPTAVVDAHRWRSWQADRVDAWGRLMIFVIVAMLGGVLARVVQLESAPDPRLAAAVGVPSMRRVEPARRGDLLDRRGRIIATTTLRYRLFVDPGVVDDLSTVAVDITNAIGGDPADVDRRLAGRERRRYVVVNDLLEGWQVDAVRVARIPGVALESRPVRHHPCGTVAAAVVGVVGFEHSGLSGMEHRLDDALLARAGRLVFLRDARSRPLWIEPADYRPGRDGADVRLSIDLVVQAMAEERLRDAVEDVNAGGGRILVMDCRTGEVLAMHDVLNARPGWDEQTHDEARERNPGLGRNRIFTDPYEPGSTFKPFIWSVATKLGLARPDEVLPTPAGRAYVTGYGRRIRDSHYHGPSTWRDVLVRSMNSGMAIVAERMTHRMMQDAVQAFGFGQLSGSGMPGESRGIVTSVKAWSDYTQSSVAMGHEIAVTPIQMVRAFSAFARDGTIPTPRLTAIAGEGRAPRFLHRAVPPELATTTRRILRDVIREGTGRRARSALYSMFGKSGTAQLPKAAGGGYHEDRYVSSFIAGAPYPDPRLVVLCIIDDPDRAKGHYGGAIAGPAVRDVIDGALTYLGVEPDL